MTFPPRPELGATTKENNFDLVDAWMDTVETRVEDLSARFDVLLPPIRHGLVTLGDSITIGNTPPTGATPAPSDAWPTYACAISQQALRYIRNAGVGGNISAQMLARFDTDVTPHNPKIVSIVAGSNDLMQGVPHTTIRENIVELVAMTREIGAQPILGTVPPRTGGEALVRAHNRWIRSYALSSNVPLVDFFSVLADGQAWKPGLDSGDGTHPSPEGYKRMGAEFSRVVTPILDDPFVPPLATSDTPDSIIPNGIFAVNPGNPSIGLGWGTYGTASNFTLSLEPDGRGGNLQVVSTSVAGNHGVHRTFPKGTNWEDGDTLEFAARVITPDGGSCGTSAIFTTGSGSTVIQIARNISRAADGIYYLRFTVPAGSTQVQIIFIGQQPGVYKIGQATLRKVS